MSDLARRAVRGTMAVAAATLVSRAVSFLGALYVIGQVPPGEFGVVDFAVALLAICGSLTNWGFSQAAIHRQERVDETFATYFVLRVVLLACGVAILTGGAIALGPVLREHTRFDLFLALCAAILIEAGSEAPAARLARDLRFRELAIVDLVSAVVATAVGVAMAAYGFGAWALVGNRLAHPVMRLLGFFLVGAGLFRVGFHVADAKWLMAFGFPLWLGGLATTWVLKYDDLVVGAFRDPETLGHYGRAYTLALVPLSIVTGVLTRVSFPLYARLQDDRARLSEAFRLASGTTLRLAAPMALAMALVLPDFVVVMGWTRPEADWRPMVPLFRWLLIYTLLRPLMDDAGGLLTAAGRPKVTGHTLLAEAAVLLMLCPTLTWWLGAAGAAISVGLVVFGGLVLWYTRFLPRLVDIAYGRMLLGPALALMVGAACGLAVQRWAALELGLAGGIAKLCATLTGYILALAVLDWRGTVHDVRLLVEHAFERRPIDG